MSTRIDSVEAAPAPRAIRIRLAAAIGLMLLAIGLAVGLIVGGAAGRERPAGRLGLGDLGGFPRQGPDAQLEG